MAKSEPASCKSRKRFRSPPLPAQPATSLSGFDLRVVPAPVASSPEALHHTEFGGLVLAGSATGTKNPRNVWASGVHPVNLENRRELGELTDELDGARSAARAHFCPR